MWGERGGGGGGGVGRGGESGGVGGGGEEWGRRGRVGRCHALWGSTVPFSMTYPLLGYLALF